MQEEKEQYWYFTFGYDQNPGIGYYTKIYGTINSTREKMFQLYGDKWSFQYKSPEAAGVYEFGLKEVI